MAQVARRPLLRWIAAGSALALTGCTPEPRRPSATGSGTATPTQPMTATPELPAEVEGVPFGPDGSHWPKHTPRPAQDLPSVEVECRWDGIRAAISAVTPEQAAQGLQILVAPGTLDDLGGRDVLTHVGRTDWARNVLVLPRDGWGTVTMTGQTRFTSVHGVTFARFDAEFVGLHDCSRTAWAHSKLGQGLRIYAEQGNVSHCDVYEAVVPEAKVAEQDPFAYVAGHGVTLRDCTWEGCYGAPIFRPESSRAHLDTLQMFGGGYYRGLVLKDTVLFGAHNSALQLGGLNRHDPHEGTPFVTLDHSLLVSQTVANATRYPAPPGAELPPRDQVINGAGEPGQLYAKRSVVIGTIYTTQWAEVTSSFTSAERVVQSNRAAKGGWTFDEDLVAPSSRFLDKMSHTPDDDFLATIWS